MFRSKTNSMRENAKLAGHMWKFLILITLELLYLKKVHKHGKIPSYVLVAFANLPRSIIPETRFH